MSTNRPTQGKNIAAFNIMSSSATGGYLDALHSGFTGSIDITNFHEDLNPIIDKVPFQGPFTERWVGGRQHRHQELVTGSVNPLQRAESIKLVLGGNQLKVYGADHPSLHQARAVLYREPVAKRPLNIANIQYGTGSQSLGNFQHNYQVVQTSGRTANPRHFAESNSSYQAFPERMTHEGDVINSELNNTGSLRNFTLPTRTKHKSIIAERFSAPGDRYTMSRGFLNTSGEEMSVYNAMPFRNLPNRTTLRNQLTRHMKQGGYESGSASIASIHKVARNTKRTPVVIDGSETTRQVHDNYFIQHPIPQTDLQYAWITQSVGTIATTASVLYGYQPSADALNIYTASPRYLQHPAGVRQEPVIADNTYYLLTSSAGDINFEKGYSYSSWRQIRHEDPVTKYFEKNNIVPVTEIGTEQLQNGNRKETVTHHHFTEPALTSKYKPLSHTLSLDEGSTVGAYDLDSSFGNLLGFYNNSEIDDILELEPEERRTFYTRFLKDFLLGNTNLLENAALNFVKKVLHFSYSEEVFPKKENMYLNKVRVRENFAEIAGQGSNGYDVLYGTQRTFYRDSAKRSSTSALNSMGEDPSDQATTTGTFTYPLTATGMPTQAVKSSENLIYFDTTEAQYALKYTGNGTRFFEIQTSFNSATTLTFKYIIGNDQTYGGMYLENPDSGEDLLVQRKPTNSDTWTTVSTISAGGTKNVWTDKSVSISSPGSAYTIRIAQVTHSGLDFDNYAVRSVQVVGDIGGSEKPAAAFWPMRTDGNKSFQEKTDYSENVGELMQDTDDTIYGAFPVPSLSYIETTNIRKNLVSSDYVERLTETVSGKKPAYDKYENFADDFRGLSKDMSVIPEYNLSDHIDSFAGNDARPTDLVSGILKAEGATYTSSAGTNSGITEDNFFKTYVTTDEMEFHSADRDISEDHIAGALNFSTLDIDVSGIKKMRMKNGFYPITRTVQLGNLLSSSFAGRLSAFENDTQKTGAASVKRATQGLIKPLLSPGILFNTLKSGVAVDYPIYTASAPTVIEGGDNTFGDFNLSTAPDFRVPFESLYIPSKLPSGDKIRFVSSFVSDEAIALDFPYQFSWDGIFNNPKYELAMHNFLAETVDFFLEEGQLTTFKSKPQAEFADELDPNKSYYLDVRLSDIEQLNKFVEYSGNKRSAPDPFFNADVLFMDAISGSDAYYACGITQRNFLAINQFGFPKDFFGKEVLSVWKNYLDDTGWQKVQNIELDKLSEHPFRSPWGVFNYQHDPYGIIGSGSTLNVSPIARFSYGSSGFHLAIGDPYYYIDGDSNKLGAVHLLRGDTDGFKFDSDGSPTSTHYTLITSSHFSDGGQGSRNHNDGQYGGLCGTGLSLSDDQEGGLYITTLQAYHPSFTLQDGTSVPANRGIVNIFHSRSSGFTVAQGVDQGEYNYILTGSSRSPYTNPIGHGGTTPSTGYNRNLLDTQCVNFVQDYDNAASGLHIIVGSPTRSGTVGTPSYQSGSVNIYHLSDPGTNKAMLLKKAQEITGSGLRRNSRFGGSVAVGIDETGIKKEVYYFVASDGQAAASQLLTSGVANPHDQVNGRLFVFCSQSVPTPTGYSFDPGTHYVEVSASHAIYVTSSGDVVSFTGSGAGTDIGAFAYHIDGTVRYNKDTGINEVYALATVPQMSSSNMVTSYLEGGLAFISLQSLSEGTTWYQSQSITPGDLFDAHTTNVGGTDYISFLGSRGNVRLLYGSNPNNSSHNLFGFASIGGFYGALPGTGLTNFLTYPSASSNYSVIDQRYTNKAIVMFTGSLGIPESAGQHAATFADRTLSSSLTHEGSFVNKQHGKLFGLGIDRVMDPGYVAYTPPHFYGEATARIKYKPSTSTKPTIREIFENATVEHILALDESRVATHSGRQRKYRTLTPTQDAAKMTLASALDLFGTTTDPDEIEFNERGARARARKRTSQTGASRWVISTKFECPVLDSRDYDTQYSSSYSSHDSSIVSSFGFTGSTTIVKPKTPWTNYGVFSEDVLPSMGVVDSFSEAAYNSTTGSLLDVVGFEAETRKISKLAESKQVKEAILVFPYIEKRNTSNGKAFLDKNSFSPIRLAKEDIRSSMRRGESTDGIYRIPDMLADMKKYHIPPRLDFLNYANNIKDKFAMFFVEVEHTFDRDDLSKIWQGLMPKIAEEMDGELFNDKLKVSIKDFFGEYGGRPPAGIKFAIFKVKQKAKKNYFKTTADSKDDKNFLVSFAGDAKERINEDRSFNWPYDYFSLVEAAKITTTINMTAEVETEEGEITVPSEQKKAALDLLLSTSAFSGQTNSARLSVPSGKLSAGVKNPEKLSDEKESEIKSAVDRMPSDTKTISRTSKETLKVTRVSKKNLAQEKTPQSKGTVTQPKENKAVGKSTGLGSKTSAVLTNQSPHASTITQPEAKNLNTMVNIIGQNFTWSSGGRR